MIRKRLLGVTTSLLAMLLVGWLGYFCVNNGAGKDESVHQDANRNTVTEKTDDSNQQRSKKQGKKTRLTQLRSALNRINPNDLKGIHQSASDIPRETQAITPDQAALIARTEPYFWEMAPNIIAHMHKAEQKDRQWERLIENEAHKAINYEESVGTDVSQIDCRQTLCKIAFSHESQDAYDRFMSGKMDHGPWLANSGGALGGRTVSEDGTLESYIYFAKKNDDGLFMAIREEIDNSIDQQRNAM